MMRRTKPEVERYVASVQAAAPSPREVSAAGGRPQWGPRTDFPWPCSCLSRRSWGVVPAAGGHPARLGAARGEAPSRRRLTWCQAWGAARLGRQRRPAFAFCGAAASRAAGRPRCSLPARSVGEKRAAFRKCCGCPPVSGAAVLEIGLLCLRPWKSQRRRELRCLWEYF